MKLESKFLESSIAHRIAFAEISAAGEAVFEREPFSLAAQEIEALWLELVGMMA